MTQDYYKADTTKHYNIPLTHLDYGYVKSCTDVKELEKILKVLRSGDEGHYAELEKETEERLQHLNPKSRLLRKDSPALRLSDLDSSEREGLSQDLETWTSNMADTEQLFVASISDTKPQTEDVEEDTNLPPVRSGKVISLDGKVMESDTQNTEKSKKKSVKPRSYEEWDKLDVDKELEKADNEPPAETKITGSSSFRPDKIAQEIDTQGMSDQEKRTRAVREKDKGNEAFQAHDFEEAVVYYSRSISICPLAATYNNRALAYLRLSKWDQAINDCNSVLSLEPKNVKALLRRGTAQKGKEDYSGARSDLDAVLMLESNNKTAQNLIKEIEKLEKKKAKEEARMTAPEHEQKGRRMVIEELDGSDEQEDKDVMEEIIVENPNDEDKAKDVPLVNGLAEPKNTDSYSGSSGQKLSGDSASSCTEAAVTSQTAVVEVMDNNSGKAECSTISHHISEEMESGSTKLHSFSAGEQNSDMQDTHCLCEKGEIENGFKPGDSVELSAAGSRDSGDSASSETNLLSSNKSDENSENSVVQELSVSVQNGQGDVKQAASETALEHSRPVFIQKPYQAYEAELREKGNNFFRSGQYPEAIEVYSELISMLEAAPDQVVNLSVIYNNRATCYLKIGNCRSAIADCGISLALIPHSAKPLLRRAAAYEGLEKYREAYVDYKHVLSIDRSIDLAHQGASRCQHSLQNQYGAQWREKLPPLMKVSQWSIPEILDEASAERISVSQPSEQPSTSACIQTEEEQKESDVAQSKEMASEEEEPTKDAATPEEEPTEDFATPEDEPIEDVATPEEEPTEDVATPEEELTEVVATPEDRFEEAKAEGNKHVGKGEYEAAAQCYCQCVELFSDRAAVFTNRALCYLKLNKPQQAEEDCNKALAFEPNNSKAFYRRALAKKAQKHYKESLQDLLQLLRLEPSNSAAKKEMEIVKGLYKEEYDQLKSQQSVEKKRDLKGEKTRKRMKIEEEEASDADEKVGEPQKKTLTSSIPQVSKHQTVTLSQSGNSQKQPSSESRATPYIPESKKLGRARTKKGIKETSIGLPNTPPSAPKFQGKITPFEFIQHWNSLKQAKEIQPYVQLLEQISPNDLPEVISNKLDGHMLQIMTRCAAHDAQTGEVERAFSILNNLRQVPRFSTVVLFLSNKEKQDIRKVLKSLGSLGTHNAEELAAVRKDYHLK